MKETDQTCLVCPASLICLQCHIKSVYECTECKAIVIYFRTSGSARDIRVKMPCCSQNKILTTCIECADEFKEEPVKCLKGV